MTMGWGWGKTGRRALALRLEGTVGARSLRCGCAQCILEAARNPAWLVVAVKMCFKGGWEEQRKQICFYNGHSGSSLGSRLWRVGVEARGRGNRVEAREKRRNHQILDMFWRISNVLGVRGRRESEIIPGCLVWAHGSVVRIERLGERRMNFVSIGVLFCFVFCVCFFLFLFVQFNT